MPFRSFVQETEKKPQKNKQTNKQFMPSTKLLKQNLCSMHAHKLKLKDTFILINIILLPVLKHF